MSQQVEQAQLIEKVGLEMEDRLNLSPLAARIYALLTISSYDGLTFEAIKEIIGASKSSMSVNVNVLVQLNYISYYTKPGDRKRYFKLSKYSSLTFLEAYQHSVDQEITIVENINAYNRQYHPEKYSQEKILGDIFEDYLREKKRMINETIEKTKKFQRSE